jgi:hypothetical protein
MKGMQRCSCMWRCTAPNQRQHATHSSWQNGHSHWVALPQVVCAILRSNMSASTTQRKLLLSAQLQLPQQVAPSCCRAPCSSPLGNTTQTQSIRALNKITTASAVPASLALTSHTSPAAAGLPVSASGADWKRKSHRATQPPDAPVAARLGRDGCTSRHSSCAAQHEHESGACMRMCRTSVMCDLRTNYASVVTASAGHVMRLICLFEDPTTLQESAVCSQAVAAASSTAKHLTCRAGPCCLSSCPQPVWPHASGERPTGLAPRRVSHTCSPPSTPVCSSSSRTCRVRFVISGKLDTAVPAA